MSSVSEGNTSVVTLSALVVDDDYILRTMHRAFLCRMGIVTTVVENGQEAVEIHRCGKSFDVIIMDMEMPVKNGIRATTELRAMGVKSLIIGASTSSNDAEIEEFKLAGLDHFYTKPLNCEKFDSIVQAIKREQS